MDNSAPIMPTSPSSFSGGGGGTSPVVFILIAILGLGTIIFGILAVTSYGQATTATKTLASQKAAAADAAKISQKKADDIANTIANESPFRSYVAPVEYGSFEVKFPKNWSSTVDQEQSGVQVTLVLNPDFVRRTDNTDELSATKVVLDEMPSDELLNQFASLVKRGTLQQNNITVSGQHGYDLTGQFADRRTTREVIIPVRDKVLIFTNENSKYATEFNEILAQSIIIP